MLSVWYELKPQAMKLRKNGLSIRDIEKSLKIPRSTLSGWFRGVELTEKQKQNLYLNWKKALLKARKKAVIWHNEQKRKRVEQSHKEAKLTLDKINLNNRNILELALSMLYLGEGSKTQATSMANSNPLIIKFFISALQTIFNIDKDLMRFELHLRSDQNEKFAVAFWSNELKLNQDVITYIKDKRIAKTKTYPNYYGVCVVNCGRVSIQRRLVHLGEEFCKIQTKDS